MSSDGPCRSLKSTIYRYLWIKISVMPTISAIICVSLFTARWCHKWGQRMVCVHTYIQWIAQCVAEIWPLEVFQDGRRPPSWMWSNRKWRPSICRPENATLEPNMKGIGWRVAELWPFEIFPKCVNEPWGRSLVGRRSSIFVLLTLISYRTVAREE